MRRQWLLLVLLLAALEGAARDRTQVYAFRKGHPCPATGLARGACPGWVVDHVVALACGGADTPANMQWQTVAAARAKDRSERRCAQR